LHPHLLTLQVLHVPQGQLEDGKKSGFGQSVMTLKHYPTAAAVVVGQRHVHAWDVLLLPLDEGTHKSTLNGL
jgi:hypothetical protein